MKARELCALIDHLAVNRTQKFALLTAKRLLADIEKINETNEAISESYHEVASRRTCLLSEKNRTARIYCKGYQPSGFAGKIIVWFSNSRGLIPTSHVSFIYGKENDSGEVRPWETEARSKEGVVEHWHNPKYRTGQYYYMDVTKKEFDIMIKSAQSIIGCDYDKPGICGMVSRSRREDPDKWFCSESLSWIVAQANRWLSRKPHFKMTPYDCVTSNEITPCSCPDEW